MTREEGSAAVELAVLAPVLVMLLLFVVVVSRLVGARQALVAAAADSARAASIEVSPDAARRAATQAAEADLAGKRLSCSRMAVVVDTTRFGAGGVISVRLACTVTMADLSLLRLPGSETLHGSSSAPIDAFRQMGSG